MFFHISFYTICILTCQIYQEIKTNLPTNSFSIFYPLNAVGFDAVEQPRILTSGIKIETTFNALSIYIAYLNTIYFIAFYSISNIFLCKIPTNITKSFSLPSLYYIHLIFLLYLKYIISLKHFIHIYTLSIYILYFKM